MTVQNNEQIFLQSTQSINGIRTHKCTIGLLYRHEDCTLATLDDLLTHMRDVKEYNKWAASCVTWPIRKAWTLKQYADFRYSTDMDRFSYCPFCGKKINWKEIANAADRKNAN